MCVKCLSEVKIKVNWNFRNVFVYKLCDFLVMFQENATLFVKCAPSVHENSTFRGLRPPKVGEPTLPSPTFDCETAQENFRVPSLPNDALHRFISALTKIRSLCLRAMGLYQGVVNYFPKGVHLPILSWGVDCKILVPKPVDWFPVVLKPTLAPFLKWPKTQVILQFFLIVTRSMIFT